jgi:predicted ATP-grasp superfamily ATP-dependent carboligase
MSALPSIIVLGVDTPIGLSVMRELGAKGVPVHAIGRTATALGSASRYCTSFFVRPNSSPLAQWLPDHIRSTGAKALMAISEGDLLDLAAMPEDIEGCRILTPRAAPLALALDKRLTLALAETIGILIPKSWQPLAGGDWTAEKASLTFPLIAKWADPPAVLSLLEEHGIAFEKAERIDRPDQLEALLTRYQPIGVWPLIQSFCPGKGLGQMLSMADGRATLRFQHLRLHEWPPEGGVSTLCEAIDPALYAEQMAKSEALLAAMGWEGPAMVEYRHDPVTGRFVLMEVNGRFWGSLPLARHAGASFAWAHYAHIFGLPFESPSIRTGTKARFLIPETWRLIRILKTDEAEGRVSALATWIGAVFDPKLRHYVYDADDPGPFWRDMRNAIGSIVRRGKQG